MTRATNDNFLHLTLAQQWLRGDWPVRDFFDQGWVLQYSLSAAAHLLFGEKLGGESVIVAVAWAVSTFLAYQVVQRLTGSRVISAACALLLIVSSARGYSYPKGIVYAVAAALWWQYVSRPTTLRIVGFGAWTAVAFYWRPDHGVYVAAGLTLAAFAAHGASRLLVTRCLTAGAVTVALVAPFLLYVQLVYGLVPYVQTGLAAARVEHASHGTHEWPLVRYASELVTFEPAERFAPAIGLRWNPSSSPEQRQDIRSRYQLTPVGTDADDVERVRLSPESIDKLRTLINEPLVDDTAGIDRSSATLTEKDWPSWQRRKFAYRLLRMQLLPTLDPQTRASEFVAAFFFVCPIALLFLAPWVSSRLVRPAEAGPYAAPRAYAGFALFALLVAWAMIRNPFSARVADAVVLSSIAFGCCAGAVWRARRPAGPVSTILRRTALALVIATVVMTTATAGRFDGPVRWWRGAPDTYAELNASPPLSFYVGRPARFSLQLAAYVRDCVPAGERVLVLWFEPEIYYFSDRLMALRHGVFAPTWSGLEHEQRVALEKVKAANPPVVLARRSSIDDQARATFPGIVAHVEREYRVAATVSNGGEEYLIYARRDRPVLRTFDAQTWPCFTPKASTWERVGGRQSR